MAYIQHMGMRHFRITENSEKGRFRIETAKEPLLPWRSLKWQWAMQAYLWQPAIIRSYVQENLCVTHFSFESAVAALDAWIEATEKEGNNLADDGHWQLPDCQRKAPPKPTGPNPGCRDGCMRHMVM